MLTASSGYVWRGILPQKLKLKIDSVKNLQNKRTLYETDNNILETWEEFRETKHFRPNQIDQLRKLFDAADTDKDGRLDIEEFSNLLETMGSTGIIDRSDSKWLLLISDQNNDGMLNLREFLYMCYAIANANFAQNEGLRTREMINQIVTILQNRKLLPHDAENSSSKEYNLNTRGNNTVIITGENNTTPKLGFNDKTQRQEFIKWARRTFEGDVITIDLQTLELRENNKRPFRNDFMRELISSSGDTCDNSKALARQQLTLVQCSALADWYHYWDRDRDGFINLTEFSNMLSYTGLVALNASAENVTEIFSDFDVDNDEKLDFREFLNLWASALHDPKFSTTSTGYILAYYMHVNGLHANY